MNQMFRYTVVSCIGRYVWNSEKSFHDYNRFKRIATVKKPWQGMRLSCST